MAPNRAIVAYPIFVMKKIVIIIILIKDLNSNSFLDNRILKWPLKKSSNTFY